ncbi:M64 family metallopeptidase [Riemerella anatipestifer]|nr:M64 family metallopeptidase [Riemerella anatipestifer]MDY3325813.1 M64 family metallopeptidase [Riemerella anatipestifer]MDY3354355.1 M64 family metallopeptidase [Riemerella anatipestifer]
MKIKYHLLIITMLILSQISIAQTLNFDDYFTSGSLRIDLLLTGNHTYKAATIHQLKKEPHYGGGTSAQLIFPNLGNYRIVIKDELSKKMIFSKGFSPIFSEWQATEEAKNKYKSFENTLTVPFPKHNIILEVQSRERDGSFSNLLTEAINPNQFDIIKETPSFYPSTKIYGHKSPQNAVDIAILAEGYTTEEMPKFKKDAQRFIDYTMSVEPFKSNRNHFNVYIIESPSQESGTDIPGENIYKNTILNSHFYTFGEPRYLTALSSFKISDIAANVPYDQIFVIVNTPRYGGGGFYNVINLVSADNYLSEKVFVHEFGHGFAGLGDEYYNNSGGTTDLYNLKVEPWEPNLTTLVDFGKKWKHKVNKNIPIPTPRTELYKNSIGVFEGGGYTPKGIYSPVQDCRMKSNTPENFCPVCTDALLETILFYTR